MNKKHIYLIDEILNNESCNYDSLLNHLKNNPDNIHKLKESLILDSTKENHDLIIKYIKINPVKNRKEILDEISKIYRNLSS